MKIFKYLFIIAISFHNFVVASSSVTKLNNAWQLVAVKAIQQNRVDDAIKIIKHHPEILNHIGFDGLTLLHHAVALFQYDSVKILIDCGAKPTQENSYGETAIDFAKAYRRSVRDDMGASVQDKNKAHEILKAVSPKSKRKTFSIN